ncbi:MAG: DUF3368 domain-containing protein [Candidatus Aminicenantes bacterium]|nr:DUF3368 domain-containing protein [Candidatus Aminicenantes bacterium]
MKKTPVVILDASPVISLAILKKLELLPVLFGDIFIPLAVWEEVTKSKSFPEIPQVTTFFEDRVKKTKSANDLVSIMGYGESEAVLLYRELKADFLIIDDRRARMIAEESGVNCIGTLAVLMKAKKKGLEPELRSLFITLLENKRYYKKGELNKILSVFKEKELG